MPKPASFVQPIHFEDFDGSHFERLVFAYHWRSEKWRSLEWYGQTGSDFGRDIWGVRKNEATDGESVCIQCVNRTRLTFAKADVYKRQTYAKLNGIPWLLKANPTIAHELVIGLGSASIAEGRLGDRERYVGITTVFSGDGNYHLTNVSRAVTMDDYQAAFLDALRKAVSKVQQDMNWQAKDHVRLVFHASFKRFNKNEINAVKALMAELGDFEVEYAFLQLSEEHPYLIFDTSQNGAFDYDTKRSKGVYAPKRASTLQLSNRDVLLCLTGPNEVKRPEDGMPSPLLLSLHKDSSFTDMTYLTQMCIRDSN